MDFSSFFSCFIPSFLIGTNSTDYHLMRTTQKAKLIPQRQTYLFVASSFSSWLAAEKPAGLQTDPSYYNTVQIKSFPRKTSSSMSSAPCPLLCAAIVDSCVCTKENDSLKLGCCFWTLGRKMIPNPSVKLS